MISIHTCFWENNFLMNFHYLNLLDNEYHKTWREEIQRNPGMKTYVKHCFQSRWLETDMQQTKHDFSHNQQWGQKWKWCVTDSQVSCPKVKAQGTECKNLEENFWLPTTLNLTHGGLVTHCHHMHVGTQSRNPYWSIIWNVFASIFDRKL